MITTTVMIPETFTVTIMQNMTRIIIENRVRTKGIIEFCLSHRDVARVLNVYNIIFR